METLTYNEREFVSHRNNPESRMTFCDFLLNEKSSTWRTSECVSYYNTGIDLCVCVSMQWAWSCLMLTSYATVLLGHCHQSNILFPFCTDFIFSVWVSVCTPSLHLCIYIFMWLFVGMWQSNRVTSTTVFSLQATAQIDYLWSLEAYGETGHCTVHACISVSVSLSLSFMSSFNLSFTLISFSYPLVHSFSFFSDLGPIEEAAGLVLVKWPLRSQITPPPAPQPIHLQYSSSKSRQKQCNPINSCKEKS